MRALVLPALLSLAVGCAIVPIPPVEISGAVRDPEGEPIANSTVVLRMMLSSLWAGDWNVVLQITRTDVQGRYRFLRDADRDVRFPVEFREYAVFAASPGYRPEWSGWLPPSSDPVDLALEPRSPLHLLHRDDDCSGLCAGLSRADTRRVAEFHYGDKTRCDAFHEAQY